MGHERVFDSRHLDLVVDSGTVVDDLDLRLADRIGVYGRTAGIETEQMRVESNRFHGQCEPREPDC